MGTALKRTTVITWGVIVAVCGVIGGCSAGMETATIVWRLASGYRWLYYIAAAFAIFMFARACFDAGRNAKPAEEAYDAMMMPLIVALVAGAVFAFSR